MRIYSKYLYSTRISHCITVTMSWQYLCYGRKITKTISIERFLHSHRLFISAFLSKHKCSPRHASLFLLLFNDSSKTAEKAFSQVQLSQWIQFVTQIRIIQSTNHHKYTKSSSYAAFSTVSLIERNLFTKIHWKQNQYNRI